MQALRTRRASKGRSSGLTVYHAIFSVVCLIGLIAIAALHPWKRDDLGLLFWVAVIASAELLPVPGWGSTQLTISLPLLMAVVFLFPPELAALVVFAGSWDPREFRREVGIWKALFNRCQAALSVLLGGVVFHAFTSLSSDWPELIAFALLATLTFEISNASFVAVALGLTYNTPLKQIYRDLAGANVVEFLFFYVGLGLLGIPLARLYELENGEWAIVFFLLPLVLARQMFSRSQALQEVTNELREREKVLRQLSNRMAEERYDERRQIAGYLHDDLAQMLFRLGLQADSARSQMERGDLAEATTSLDNVESIKDDSVKLVRGLIKDLDRSPLGRAGLTTALATIASEESRDGQVRFHLDVSELALPPPIQLLAYQIAREAVQNAVKHAAPKNVWITLEEVGDDVLFTVRDDGVGFNAEGPLPEGHFGLAIMRERAMLAGGRLALSSSPGGGTQIQVTINRSWLQQSEDGQGAQDRAASS